MIISRPGAHYSSVMLCSCPAQARLSHTKDTGSRPVVRSSRRSLVRVCKYMNSRLPSRLNRSVGRWSRPSHINTEMQLDRTEVMRRGEKCDDAWMALDDNNSIMIEEMIHNTVLSVRLPSLCACFLYRHIHRIRADADCGVISSWKKNTNFSSCNVSTIFYTIF